MEAGRLPDAVIIGAMRSGTTSLFNRLVEHPRIGGPALKEPDFFAYDDRRGRDLRWYRSIFAGVPADSLAIEASATYTRSYERPGTPARMAALVPDAKLIYILRDPIERMRSHYAFNWNVSGERRPPETAFTDRLYVDPSTYAHQLALFEEHYAADRIHVLRLDDLSRRPAETLDAVVAFLGLPPHLFDETAGRADNAREVLRTDSGLRLFLRERVHRPLDFYRKVVPYDTRVAVQKLTTRTPPPLPEPAPLSTALPLATELRADLDQLTSNRGIDTGSWITTGELLAGDLDRR